MQTRLKFHDIVAQVKEIDLSAQHSINKIVAQTSIHLFQEMMSDTRVTDSGVELVFNGQKVVISITTAEWKGDEEK